MTIEALGDDGNLDVRAECDVCGAAYADANGEQCYRRLEDLVDDMSADGWQHYGGHVRCDLHRWHQCDSCGCIALNGMAGWPEPWICPDCGDDA